MVRRDFRGELSRIALEDAYQINSHSELVFNAHLV